MSGAFWGWVRVMKLRDVLDHDQLLLVSCQDCNAKTPLDPAYFALRLGVNAPVSDLRHEVLCPVCGSAEIVLGVHSPVVQRETATPIAVSGAHA